MGEDPLLWFGWGVVAVVVAMAFAYFTNYAVGAHSFALYAGNAAQATKVLTVKNIFHAIAILGTLCSLSFFLFGMYQVRRAIILLAQ